MQPRQALIVGALLAGLSVTSGAFGAHWLKNELPRRGLSVDEQRYKLETWDVAVRYQMYHALGLIAIGVLGPSVDAQRLLRWAGVLFLAGTVVFSGCLYVLVLTGLKVLGAIVPLGGLAMIAGWFLLALAAKDIQTRSY